MITTMLRGRMKPRLTGSAEERSGLHLVPESAEVRAARVIASLRDNPRGDDHGQQLAGAERAVTGTEFPSERQRVTG